MARYEATSKLSSDKLVSKAAERFAALTGGLSISSKTTNSLCLEGPDGYVTISICPKDAKGKMNVMEIETDHFDDQVKDFLREL